MAITSFIVTDKSYRIHALSLKINLLTFALSLIRQYLMSTEVTARNDASPAAMATGDNICSSSSRRQWTVTVSRDHDDTT